MTRAIILFIATLLLIGIIGCSKGNGITGDEIPQDPGPFYIVDYGPDKGPVGTEVTVGCNRLNSSYEVKVIFDAKEWQPIVVNFETGELSFKVRQSFTGTYSFRIKNKTETNGKTFTITG